jgi:hypothetical protein
MPAPLHEFVGENRHFGAWQIPGIARSGGALQHAIRNSGQDSLDPSCRPRFTSVKDSAAQTRNNFLGQLMLFAGIQSLDRFHWLEVDHF